MADLRRAGPKDPRLCRQTEYARTFAGDHHHPWREWLRTYVGHERGAHYLTEPGGQDITVQVMIDQLSADNSTTTQQNNEMENYLLDNSIDETNLENEL